ncbi:MAG TPA: hypothetical protein VGR48_02555 [Terriglobales bacterium]|nr:hypothetical protein [Terriglobales bacterium]
MVSPRRIAAALLLANLSLAALPQERPKTAPQPAQPGATQPETEQQIRKREESQRILGVMPLFGVTSRKNAQPLTARQKFHLFAKSAFDPFVFGVVGVQAGISQADNQFPDYGQGAAGFGKRYGAALGDSISSNFFSNFLYPTLFKQDPRYFRLGEGSTKRRIGYALAQEVVGHTDHGRRSFNFANVLGAVSAGGISNLYYPDSDRGFGLTMSRAGIALFYGSAGGLLDEFWPDIDRKLFHKQPKPVSNPHP